MNILDFCWCWCGYGCCCCIPSSFEKKKFSASKLWFLVELNISIITLLLYWTIQIPGRNWIEREKKRESKRLQYTSFPWFLRSQAPKLKKLIDDGESTSVCNVRFVNNYDFSTFRISQQKYIFLWMTTHTHRHHGYTASFHFSPLMFCKSFYFPFN